MDYFREQLNKQDLEYLDKMMGHYSISDELAPQLKYLKGVDIIIIADDSESMNRSEYDYYSSSEGKTKYDKCKTRWDKLKLSCTAIVDISNIVNKNGIDIYFMNRKSVLKEVRSTDQFENVFDQEPAGNTAIVPILEEIFKTKSENKRLIIILTDGKPTDKNGEENTQEFIETITKKYPDDYINIIVILSKLNGMEYLDKFKNNKKIKNTKVIYDIRHYNTRRPYSGTFEVISIGDYIIRCLLSSIAPCFNDEPKQKKKCILM